jgi:hypothetical protein
MLLQSGKPRCVSFLFSPGNVNLEVLALTVDLKSE